MNIDVIKENGLEFHVDENGVLRRLINCEEARSATIPHVLSTGTKITAIGSEFIKPDEICNKEYVPSGLIIGDPAYEELMFRRKQELAAEATRFNKIIVSDEISKIEEAAFAYSNVDVVQWPQACKVIPARCFEHSKLFHVTRTEDVESIGEDAFADSGIIMFEIPPKCDSNPNGVAKGCFRNSKIIKVLGDPAKIYKPGWDENTPCSNLFFESRQYIVDFLKLIVERFDVMMTGMSIEETLDACFGPENAKEKEDFAPASSIKIHMNRDLIESNVRTAVPLAEDAFLKVVADSIRDYYFDGNISHSKSGNIKTKADLNETYLKDMLNKKYRKYKEEDYLDNLNSLMDEQLENDLTVEHDCENYDWELVTIKDGLPGIIAIRGGDWEDPIATFIYSDDGVHLRAYIPTYGNPFNLDTMQAFGNDEDADVAYLVKETGNPEMEPYYMAGIQLDAVKEAISEAITVA